MPSHLKHNLSLCPKTSCSKSTFLTSLPRRGRQWVVVGVNPMSAKHGYDSFNPFYYQKITVIGNEMRV